MQFCSSGSGRIRIIYRIGIQGFFNSDPKKAGDTFFDIKFRRIFANLCFKVDQFVVDHISSYFLRKVFSDRHQNVADPQLSAIT